MNTLETVVRKLKSGLGLSSSSPLVQRIRPTYDSLLAVCYGRRGLERVINGEETIRIHPAHRYAHEDYEPAVFAYLRRTVLPGAVVLDIGAHVGIFAVILARWAGRAGHVYAFEPASQTRAALHEHLALNEVENRVTVVPLAVSDTAGAALLYSVSNSPENTLSRAHGRLPGACPVEIGVTTIDAFCAAARIVPTLLKIDVEGYELHVLRGARETLARHRPGVVVELHPMNWPEIGVDAGHVEEFLTQTAYRAVALDGQKHILGQYGHVVLEPIS